MLQVEVCRPYPAVSLATLSAMSMANFHALNAVDGSRVSFVTLSTGVMARAAVTNQITGGGGAGSFSWY